MSEEQQLEQLVEDLQQMVRQEQQLVTAGRLDEVVIVIQRRQQLIAQVPLETVPEGAIRQALQGVFEEGGKTLTLLCAIRDELADRLGEGQDVRHAVGKYAGSSRI